MLSQRIDAHLDRSMRTGNTIKQLSTHLLPTLNLCRPFLLDASKLLLRSSLFSILLSLFVTPGRYSRFHRMKDDRFSEGESDTGWKRESVVERVWNARSKRESRRRKERETIDRGRDGDRTAEYEVEKESRE
jgi:hypothetical protein